MTMLNKGVNGRPGPKRMAAFVLALGVVGSCYAFALSANSNDDVYQGTSIERESSNGSDELSVAPEGSDDDDDAAAQVNYSRFTHTNPTHSRLPCLLCHRRDDNSARLRFPGKPDHLPCAGCHTAQLSDPSSPMCGICHTNAQAGAMKAFPPLRSFRANFDHGRHIRQTNCATCHKPARRGIAFSMPRGASAHLTCFQCHTADKPIGACNVCHTLGRPVRASESAKAFGVNFGHQEHLRGRGMSCSSCHTVRAGAARGRQVSSPLASMHFAPSRAASCAACHNGRRAFGTNDFSNCKRCHEGQSFRF
jgi:c(7)-type cytochrome triheme protein